MWFYIGKLRLILNKKQTGILAFFVGDVKGFVKLRVAGSGWLVACRLWNVFLGRGSLFAPLVLVGCKLLEM